MEMRRVLGRVAAAPDRAQTLAPANSLTFFQTLRVLIEMGIVVDRLSIIGSYIDRVAASIRLKQLFYATGSSGEDGGTARSHDVYGLVQTRSVLARILEGVR